MALWANGISAPETEMEPKFNGAGAPIVPMSPEQKCASAPG